MSAEKYGNLFWSVETLTNVQMVFADRVEVRDGCLLFFRNANTETGKEELMSLGFAPGEWSSFGAASVFDGARVAVDSVAKRAARGPHFQASQ